MERGINAERAAKGRPRLLRALDEVDGQADDLVALHLDLPDHELAGDPVGPPAIAGEVDARRVSAERESLGAVILADLQEAVAGAAEINVPAAEAADANRDAAVVCPGGQGFA